MKAFLMGLGVGAVIGVSMAPNAGQASRKKLAQQGNDLLDRVQKTVGSVLGGGEKGSSRAQDRGDEKNQVREAGQQNAGQQQHQKEAQDEVAYVLNTARKAELTSVQGIGDATAKRIIKNRPFESAEEVLEKKVVPENVLENVKHKLVGADEEVA